MTFPFGCVSVCHLPEQPGFVPRPCRATLPGAARAQWCGPVTQQGAFPAVGAADRPCATLHRLQAMLQRHLQEGTLQASRLHGSSASCLPPNATHTFPVDQKLLTDQWQHTHRVDRLGKKADHYWDAPGKRPVSVGRQRQGSKAVGRKRGKSREALWPFLPL